MTPLLHKFVQECEHPVPDGVDTLPLRKIYIFKTLLKYEHPNIYEEYNGIDVDVGIEWIRTNLSNKEYAEFIAMRFRGQVK